MKMNYSYERCPIDCPINLPNMMSVVRLSESMIDSLQLYRLSYFVLMTLSFTFIAGAHNLPACDIWYNRWTPVILSSTIPYKQFLCEFCNYFNLYIAIIHYKIFLTHQIHFYIYYTLNVPTLNMELNFFTRRCVASPPSSRTMLGCQFSPLIHLKYYSTLLASVELGIS